MAKDNLSKELNQENEWFEEYEGQLAVDVYQNEDSIVIKAPIAGVSSEDLDISITDDVVVIKGDRKVSADVTNDNYFAQECYWGSFSRSYVLPVAVDSDQAQAKLKDGMLTITIPKLEKSKTRTLKIQAEE